MSKIRPLTLPLAGSYTTIYNPSILPDNIYASTRLMPNPRFLCCHQGCRDGRLLSSSTRRPSKVNLPTKMGNELLDTVRVILENKL